LFYTGTLPNIEAMTIRKDFTRIVPCYRICELVLGENLIKHAEKDEEITKWVSREEWMILPLPEGSGRIATHKEQARL
jgi:hypothetical protein